jgi:CspA family cold shock protein
MYQMQMAQLAQWSQMMMAAMMQGGPGGGMSGTVKKLMEDKGYGFIKPDDGSEDVFVHFKAFPMDFEVKEGMKVMFSKNYDDHRDKYVARNVRILDGGGRDNERGRGGYRGGRGDRRRRSRSVSRSPDYASRDDQKRGKSLIHLCRRRAPKYEKMDVL